MKKFFRKIIGYIVVSPFVVASKFLSIFLGKQKAIEVVGPRLTKSAKRFLKFWIPKIDGAEDFASFPAKMKKNFRLWEPLYDIEISEESNDVFKLHVSNCPFCEALNRLGMSKLSPYVCEGDWAIARDNADKWKFERNYQIGTGDSYCDHTYKRIQ
jgi:predicted ArsR family transcriptional regulator